MPGHKIIENWIKLIVIVVKDVSWLVDLFQSIINKKSNSHTSIISQTEALT